MELSREEAKILFEAITIAEYELATLHGLTVYDNLEAGQIWMVDLSEALRLVGRAFDIVESKRGKRHEENVCCNPA